LAKVYNKQVLLRGPCSIVDAKYTRDRECDEVEIRSGDTSAIHLSRSVAMWTAD